MDRGSSCQLGSSIGSSIGGVRGCYNWLTYAVYGDFGVPNRI